MAEVEVRPRGGSLRWFVTGVAAGFAAAYILDPRAGHGRRVRLVDEAGAGARRGVRWTRRQTRHAMSTAAGTVFRYRPHGTPGPVDDLTLVDRVQSEVFEDATMPKASLLFEAVHGVVTIRGEVESPSEIQRVGAAVRRIEGVRAVRNLLHVPGSPAPNKEAAITA